MTTPTARTLDECRRRGWLATVVERWIPQDGSRFGKRKDAFGFGDVLVLDGQPGSLLIQATSRGGASARKRKIAEERGEAARAWLACGNRLAVWGWWKNGRRWEPDIVPVTLLTEREPGAIVLRAVEREAELRAEVAAERRARKAVADVG